MNRIIWKRHLVLIGSLCSLACSDSTGPGTPPPAYPALSGTFNLQATFDAFPASLANGNGTITFVQPDRNQPGLSGTSNISVVAGGSTGVMTTVRNVFLTTTGTISFQVGTASTTAAWGFDGTLSADGRTITGRHTLIGTSSYPGNWTATKQ